MDRFALLMTGSLALAIGCTSDDSDKEDGTSDSSDTAADDSSDTGTDAAFGNEIALSPFTSDSFETLNVDSDPDRSSYFPVRHYFWPVGLTALEAPEPPYEIRALSIWVMAGANAACNDFNSSWDCQEAAHCDTRTPLKLVAYVGETPPRSFAGGDNDLELPDLPYTASVEVSGGYGAPADWDAELLTGTLDEPVLVEESGTLWVGYAQTTESGVNVPCVAGYNAYRTELSEEDLDVFVWWEQNNLFTGGGTGWNITDPNESEQLRPVVQAVVGY